MSVHGLGTGVTTHTGDGYNILYILEKCFDPVKLHFSAPVLIFFPKKQVFYFCVNEKRTESGGKKPCVSVELNGFGSSFRHDMTCQV